MPEKDYKTKSIDPNRTAICWWCGTTESDDWIVTGTHVYCSNECLWASNYKQNATCGSVLLVVALLMILVNPAASALGFGVSILMFCCAFEGKQYIDRRDRYGAPPRDKFRSLSVSRTYASEQSQIMTVCSYCGQLNDADAAECENCGASLVRADLTAISSSDSNRARCPWCSAVYLYRPANFRKDDTVVCQNCNKPFTIEDTENS